MTHDPDHGRRATNTQDSEPWELRGTQRPSSRTERSTGLGTTTRVVIALLLVAALVVPLMGFL